MFPVGAMEPSGSAGWKHVLTHGSEAGQRSLSFPVTSLIDTVKEATSSCLILTGSVIEFSSTSPLQPARGPSINDGFFLALGISPCSHSFYLIGSSDKTGSSKSPTPYFLPFPKVPHEEKCLGIKRETSELQGLKTRAAFLSSAHSSFLSLFSGLLFLLAKTACAHFTQDLRLF